METDIKYFLFDEKLFNQGYMYNCCCEAGQLKVSSVAISKSSSSIKSDYISKPLDSREAETIWHRLKLDFDAPGDSSIAFSYFASDTKTVLYHDEWIDLYGVISDSKINIDDKMTLLSEIFTENIKNPNDLLLFNAKGRYFYFKIELIAHDTHMPSINGIRIEFPMNSFVDDLPEFYKSNVENYSFLSRFLGIYQSLYLDLEENITQISRYFDADFVEKDFLKYLANWVAIDDIYIWSEDKLRYVINNAFRLYKLKGTKQGLSEIVEIYTGKKPIIIETYKIMAYYEKTIYDQMYKQLYGTDIYCFCVIVDEQAIKTQQNFVELSKLIELYKPAHTIAKVILLKPSIVLGQHTYVGVNSNLAENDTFKLIDATTIPFNTTIFD
jgi:phage tail-like protein